MTIDELGAALMGGCYQLTEKQWIRVRARLSICPHGGCWLVSDTHMDGYSRGNFGGRHALLHRVVYLSVNKMPLPPSAGQGKRSFEVLHSCDVRNCINPAHLSGGTHSENMKDAAQKGRMRGRVLTEEQVAEARQMKKDGVIFREIAKHFGMTGSGMRQAIYGSGRSAREYHEGLENAESNSEARSEASETSLAARA